MDLSKDVKYLGVILDEKLVWKSHMRAQVKKRLRVLQLCNAFIDRASGLLPKMTPRLNTRVIVPKIMYATVV